MNRSAISRALVVLTLALPLAACPGARHADEHEHGHDADDGHAAHGDHAADVDHDDVVRLDPAVARAAGVRTATAAHGVLPDVLVAPARVALDTDATAHVGVQLAGRVRELAVRRGEHVAKGDLLLVLESPERGREQVEFLAADAALGRARPAVELAERLLARARDAHEASRSLPLSAVEERELALAEATRELASAEAARSAAENRLHVLGMTQPEIGELARTREVQTRVEVRAPLAGEVLEREVTLGEVVGPERDALLVLADTTWLWVLADVPETRLRELRVDAPARITCAAAGDAVLAGRVAWIEPHVDPDTRTARVRVVVARAGTALLPGMFAEVSFPLDAAEDAAPVVHVARDALQTFEGASVVFVPLAGAAGSFAPRAVRTGRRVGDRVEVLTGLAYGEEYVEGGAFVLKAELAKSAAGHEH